MTEELRAADLHPAVPQPAGLPSADPRALGRGRAEPPGLGGLLMTLGGACCVVGGLLVASGAQVIVSPAAGALLVKALPLGVGAALVLLGAVVRRALRRARDLGAGEAALPGGAGAKGQVGRAGA